MTIIDDLVRGDAYITRDKSVVSRDGVVLLSPHMTSLLDVAVLIAIALSFRVNLSIQVLNDSVILSSDTQHHDYTRLRSIMARAYIPLDTILISGNETLYEIQYLIDADYKYQMMNLPALSSIGGVKGYMTSNPDLGPKSAILYIPDPEEQLYNWNVRRVRRLGRSVASVIDSAVNRELDFTQFLDSESVHHILEQLYNYYVVNRRIDYVRFNQVLDLIPTLVTHRSISPEVATQFLRMNGVRVPQSRMNSDIRLMWK